MSKVKELRAKYGLSREHICDAFQIPYRTLQSWELGERRCPEYVLCMMAMLLDLADKSGGLEHFKKAHAEERRKENERDFV